MRLAFCVVLLASTPAAASPLSDALARHDAKAMAQLRAASDPASRCVLGTIYARRGDLPRAGHFLANCDDMPPEVSADIARAAQSTKKLLRARGFSPIAVESKPAGLTATSTALPGEIFTTPATLWARPGTYEVRSTHDGQTYVNVFESRPNADATVWIEVSTRPARAPKQQQVDFREELAHEAPTQGSPPPVKRGSLMSKKLRGELDPAGTHPVLDDPLAARTATPTSRAHWLGVRLGGGLFDDASRSARAGISFAAAARVALAPSLFAALRLDWSRRGGETMTAVDAIGTSAGVGYRLDRFALIAQLRGDLRFADNPVSRAGLSAAVDVEYALPSTPISAGLRFEQGLTAFVPDAHDRALLLELGVDWR